MYFSALWWIFHPDQTQDFHGALYREEEGETLGPWTFKYRFRYYVDNKAHDSDDVKNWYTATLPEGATEVNALESIRMMTDMVSREYRGAPVHKAVIRSKKAEDVMKALEREPFCHIKSSR
jgi:hypothetical protein